MESLDDGTKWVRKYHSGPHSEVLVVAFPHAGGSASYYVPLSSALSPRVELAAIQYPGRQDRRLEPCIDTIEELANRCYAALRDRLTVPFAFFGHSMGAVIAFEVTRRLQRAGALLPLRLFVSGRAAPTRQFSGGVHLLDDAGLVAELRRVGGTDARFFDDDELLALILPTTRCDYRAIETYAYQPAEPVRCPIIALAGDADPQATVEEMRAWRRETARSFDLHVLPGGHFFLGTATEQVATIISEALLRESFGTSLASAADGSAA
jgi:surfactin synthase thioesterase subunit